MMRKFFSKIDRLFGLFLLLCSFSSFAVDYPNAPDPFHYVNDYTNTLSQQEWRKLEDSLIENRSKTSSQIIVAIIPTTQGEEIAQYATNLFNKWGIGRTKNNENNGVLLLVAKNDRTLFIATGRGIEGALPDATAASIIRNNITPHFKQGQFAEGIASGLTAIKSAINGEYAAYDNYKEEKPLSFWDIVLQIIFFIVLAIVAIIIIGCIASLESSDSYTSSSKTRSSSESSYTDDDDDDDDRYSSNSYESDSSDSGSGDSFGGGSSGGGGAGGSW